MKNQILMVALGVALIGFSGVVASAPQTAQNLLKTCTTPDMELISYCNGFFQAIHDQQTVAGKLCAPTGTTRTRLVEIFETKAGSLIKRRPSAGNLPAIEVAGQILNEAFPCKD